MLQLPFLNMAGLVRAILAEMLGLSASALGSVQIALTGASDSGTEQPAGATPLPSQEYTMTNDLNAALSVQGVGLTPSAVFPPAVPGPLCQFALHAMSFFPGATSRLPECIVLCHWVSQHMHMRLHSVTVDNSALYARKSSGVSEGLRVAAERLSSGFSGAAAALKAPLHRADSFSAAAKRALRAAPQVAVMAVMCNLQAGLICGMLGHPFALR